MLGSPALNVAPAAVRYLHPRMAPPAMQMQNDNQPYQSGITPYTGYNGVNPASGSMNQGRYSQYPSNNYYNQPMYDQGSYQGQYQQQYGLTQQRRDQQYNMGGYGNYNYGGGRYQQQYGLNQQRRGQQYGMGNGYGGGGYGGRYGGGYGGGSYGGGYSASTSRTAINYLGGYNQYPSQYGYNDYYDYDDYDDYGRQYPSRYGQAPSAEPEPSSPRTRSRALHVLSLLAPHRKRKAASYPRSTAPALRLHATRPARSRTPPPPPPPPSQSRSLLGSSLGSRGGRAAGAAGAATCSAACATRRSHASGWAARRTTTTRTTKGRTGGSAPPRNPAS